MSSTRRPSQNAQQNPSSAESLLSQLDTFPQVQTVKLFYKQHSHRMRPWNAFVDARGMIVPKSAQQAVDRAQFNIRFYSVNYIIVTAGILAWFLVSRIFLLLSVILIGGALLFISSQPPLVQLKLPFLPQSFTASQRNLYIATAVVAVPLLWFASAGQAFFWWIVLSGVVMLSHAMMLEKPVDAEALLEGENVAASSNV